MKNRKGYTLVEVLAVIAVIAIVLVIGVPRVNKMINTSRKKAFETNVMSVINAVKNHYQSNFYGSLDATKTVYDVKDESIIQSGNIIDYTEGKLDFEGEIRINEDGKLRVSLSNDKYCAIKNYSTELAVYEVGENDECTLGNEGEKSLLVVNLNGGITSQTFNNTYDAGTVITLIEPTRAGYAFDGWELLEGDSTLSDNTLTIGGLDTKIQALWQSLPHNLTVNLDGGILEQTLKTTYNTGELIELNNPKKAGKNFIGWMVSSGNSILSGNILTMGSNDTTITAQYSDCASGTYNDGTSSSCITCQGGTYSGAGQTSCTSCAAGTYSLGGAESCTNCRAGTYSEAGQSRCHTCPSGTYSGSGQSSCTSCAAGTYSGSGQSSCTTCPVGTYSDVGASGCSSCTEGSGTGLETCSIVCGAGTYLEAGATSCSECPAGSYCVGGTYNFNDEIDQGITGTCLAGTYSEGGATTASCQECPIGTYSGSGQSSCSICTGAYTSEAGSSSCNIPCSNSIGVTSWSEEATCTIVSCGDTYSKNGNNCELNSPVLSYYCANGSAGSSPYVMTYTGNCTMVGTETNWKVKFLTSGELTFNASIDIDVFLVGGGGSGGRYGGGGGGGGYTKTAKNIKIEKGIPNTIVVGGGGAASTGFGYVANPGKNGGGSGGVGGAGGSGGGGGGNIYNYGTGAGAGGSNGGNGYTGQFAGGAGQGSTTREFGEETGDLYAGGGGGGSYNNANGAGGSGGGGKGGWGPIPSGSTAGAASGAANTGGGGGGGNNNSGTGYGGAGGSGIVIIRPYKISSDSDFLSQKLNSGTVGITYTSNPFTAAKDDTGNYTYTIKSGAPNDATINSANRTISFPNTTSAGRYFVVVSATNNDTGTVIEATMSIDINLDINPFYSYSCANKTIGSSPYLLTYTGNCLVTGNSYEYKIKFLTSGDLSTTEDLNIDVFLVGGGGSGGRYGGGGGGGGYTRTERNITAEKNTTYAIVVGDGGAASTGFGYTANPGSNGGGSGGVGGNGGSGGGGGGNVYNYGTGAGAGGSNGGNGYTGQFAGGTGQGTTTREFGEETGDLYAGGGGGGAYNNSYGAGGAGGGGAGGYGPNSGGVTGGSSAGVANTGGGGGGGNNNSGTGYGGAGGSGIVIIRNKR